MRTNVKNENDVQDLRKHGKTSKPILWKHIKIVVIKDYVYYAGSNRVAPDFETRNEFVINYIKGKFNYDNNIAELLRNLEYTKTEQWYPSLEISQARNAVTKASKT